MQSIGFGVYVVDRVSSTLGGIGRNLDNNSSKWRTMGKVAGAAMKGLAVGLGAAAFAAVGFAKGAADDQLAARQMAIQFHNAAGATNAQVAATEDWITKQGIAKGIADDQLRPALTRLVTATKSVSEAQKLTSLGMNVAAGTGKDLQSVTMALARAYNGQTTGLGKMGIAVKDASGHALTFDQITKNLSKTFAGQAAGAANTASGQYARLKVELQEAGESIGYKLLPFATQFGNWMVEKGVPYGEKLAHQIGDELGPKVKDLGKWFAANKDDLEDFGREIVNDVIPAVTGLVHGAGTLFGIISSLPGPVKSLTGELALAALAFPKLQGAMGGSWLPNFSKDLTNAETRTEALGKAARGAAGIAGMALLIDSTHRSNQGLKDLESVAGGAAAGFAMGGPIGAGVGALAGAIGAVATSTDDAKSSFHLAKPEAADFAAELNKVSGAATDAARHTAALSLQQSGAFDAARQLGISQRDLTKYIFGNEGAIKRVNSALAAGSKEVTIWTDQYGVTHSVLSDTATAASKLNTILGTNASKFDEDRRKAQDLAIASGDLGKALKGVKDKSDIVTAFETKGYPETTRQLANILAQYDLTPKQIQTLIKATGVDTSVAAVQRLIDRLNAVHDKTVNVTTVTRNVRGGVTSSGGGHTPDDLNPRAPHRTLAQGDMSKVDYYSQLLKASGGGPDGKHKQDQLSHASAQLLASIVKGIKDGQKPLNSVLSQVQTDLQNKIDAYKAKLAESQDFAAGFQGFNTSIFATQPSSSDAPLTLQDLIDQSNSQKASSEQVLADVNKLVGEGLSASLIKQLQNQGASGIAQLHLLAGASADQIAQFNANQAEIEKNLSDAGNAAANAVFSTDVAQAKRDADQAKKLDDMLDAIRGLGDGHWVITLTGDQIQAALVANDKKHGKK